jgi:hypothetical protein
MDDDPIGTIYCIVFHIGLFIFILLVIWTFFAGACTHGIPGINF